MQGTVLKVLLLSMTQHGWQRDAIDADEAAAALQADGFDPRCCTFARRRFRVDYDSPTASEHQPLEQQVLLSAVQLSSHGKGFAGTDTIQMSNAPAVQDFALC